MNTILNPPYNNEISLPRSLYEMAGGKKRKRYGGKKTHMEKKKIRGSSKMRKTKKNKTISRK